MISFHKFDIDFLRLSWKWLNDPEIKKLTNTPDFSLDDQFKWFVNLESKTDYLIWGIKYNEVPIGACGLKNIDATDAEYFGYIGEKEYWGKGIGSQTLKYIIDYSKDQNKTSLYLNVLENNLRAIDLYTKFGFKKESFNDKNNLIKMRLKL